MFLLFGLGLNDGFEPLSQNGFKPFNIPFNC